MSKRDVSIPSVVAASLVLIVASCSILSHGEADIEKECNENPKIVVFNAKMWGEYKIKVLEQVSKKNRNTYPTFFYVDNFSYKIQKTNSKNNRIKDMTISIFYDDILISKIISKELNVKRILSFGPEYYSCPQTYTDAFINSVFKN